MKEVWASFRLAFSMYSIFPARQIKKTRRNMKYILIFVPLVGAIIGFILKQWQVISPYLIDKDLLGAVVSRGKSSWKSCGIPTADTSQLLSVSAISS